MGPCAKDCGRRLGRSWASSLRPYSSKRMRTLVLNLQTLNSDSHQLKFKSTQVLVSKAVQPRSTFIYETLSQHLLRCLTQIEWWWICVALSCSICDTLLSIWKTLCIFPKWNKLSSERQKNLPNICFSKFVASLPALVYPKKRFFMTRNLLLSCEF